MRKPIIFIVFYISFLSIAHGQDNFSESFLYTPKNIQVYIPAFAGLDNKLQSNLIYKTYVGKLSIIRTQYADLNWNIRKVEEGGRRIAQHVVGGGFYSDREGDFFNKTRILSRYALHIPISETLFLSAGISVHAINYSFHASGTGTSGSDIQLSGNLGTALSSSTFKLGASMSDFNNPEIRPINYAYVIYRYSTFYVEKTIPVGANTFLRGGGRYNQVWGHSASFLAQLGLLFSRAIGLSSFYYLDKGWGLALEVNQIKINEENQFDLSFAYQIPSQNQNPPANQYEINLQYYLKK